MLAPSKRAANGQRATGDDDNDDETATAQFYQMNCDSSLTLERSSMRRTRLPPVPPAPSNHIDQPLRSHQSRADKDAGADRPDNVQASPAKSLLLSRSNSRSNVRPSRYHPDVGYSLSSASYIPVGQASKCSRCSGAGKTVADDQRRLERVDKRVDMFLFVILVLICVGLAVFIIFASF